MSVALAGTYEHPPFPILTCLSSGRIATAAAIVKEIGHIDRLNMSFELNTPGSD